MNIKISLILMAVLASAAPLSANPNKKNQGERGMLEKMEAVTSYSVNINYMSYEKGRDEIIHDRSAGYMKNTPWFFR